MYKRPVIRSRGESAKEFVTTALPGGATRSYWAPSTRTSIIPSGHMSRVGEILDKMRVGDSARSSTRPWVPSVDYKLIVAHMNNSDAYLKMSEDWFTDHPPKKPVEAKTALDIDPSPVNYLFTKYAFVEDGPKVPPVSELEKAWRAAGYTEDRISKALVWHAKMDATSDERQKILDLIFAKFPSASKPTPKIKPKKVIKVVKKKIPTTSNE